MATKIHREVIEVPVPVPVPASKPPRDYKKIAMIVIVVAIIVFCAIVVYARSLPHEDVDLEYEMNATRWISTDMGTVVADSDKVFVEVNYTITNSGSDPISAPQLDWFSFECDGLVYDPILGSAVHVDYNDTVKQIMPGGVFESIVVFTVPTITGDDLYDCSLIFNGEYSPNMHGYYWH